MPELTEQTCGLHTSPAPQPPETAAVQSDCTISEEIGRHGQRYLRVASARFPTIFELVRLPKPNAIASSIRPDADVESLQERIRARVAALEDTA